MKEYRFCVAGFLFGVSLPDGWKAEELLPSFQPFRDEGKKGQLLFCAEVTEESMPVDSVEGDLIEDTVNDMGHVRLFVLSDGYRMEISHLSGEGIHCMQTDAAFTYAKIALCPDDANRGYALSSLLRMMFSQAILSERAVSVHASVVWADGYAYLFMGKSGTGKSTHAALWTKTFEGCSLLNDDNPVVRIEEEKVYVYGTPWSGKTPCYRNLRFPVAGMVRLKQADVNRFTLQKDADAFIALLPACSVIRKDMSLHNDMCDTLVQLAGSIPVGLLECLPDKEAVLLCREKLTRERQNYANQEAGSEGVKPNA